MRVGIKKETSLDIIKNLQGKTPLDCAKTDEVKAALCEHGGKHSLFYAVDKDMPELVAKLIEEGADAALTNGVRACAYVKT